MAIDHTHVRVRRNDLIRLKSSLEGLGGMFLTDAFHVLSFATPAEIVEMAGRAASRKMFAWQALRDAGETFDAETRREDGREADDDDISREEIDAAKRWAGMGRVHKAGAWKGQKKK